MPQKKHDEKEYMDDESIVPSDNGEDIEYVDDELLE
jgi:hypothetical protein